MLAVAVVARIFFAQGAGQGRGSGSRSALVLVGLAVVAQVGAGSDLVGVWRALRRSRPPRRSTLYFLVGERQVAATSPLVVAFWSMGFATVFWAFFSGWWQLEPALLTEPRLRSAASLEAVVVPLWALLAWNGVLGSFAPFLLSFLALKHLRATAAGIASSAEVIFAFAVAWLWLGEGLDALQLAGAAARARRDRARPDRARG